MSVREYVFQLLSNDSGMNALGINNSTLFANGAPDSAPNADVWATLRWGIQVPALPGQRDDGSSQVQRATDIDLAIWVYDRNPDYTRISAALKRWRMVMESIASARTGTNPSDGWIIQATWSGDGQDDYDDTYERWYGTSSCQVIASGA